MDRSVIVYLTSYAFSSLGNSVAAVVLPLVVLATTGSALDAGIVAAATAGPAVLAGLLMGGLIDRFNRRTMSIVTDLISAVGIAALPIVDLVSDLSLGWFVLFGILSSFGDVPGLTARETLVPGVQRRSGLAFERIVGLRESVASVTMMVGPAAAASLVVLLDGSGALWVTSGLALVAALTTFLLPKDVGRRTPADSDHSPRSSAAEMVAGMVWLARGSSLILSVTLVNLALATVLIALQGLILPVHFTQVGQEGRLGLVLTFLAAGMLVGSATYAMASARLRRRTWLVVSLTGSLVGIGVIGALPSVLWIFVGAAILGLFAGVLGALFGVVMIETIPDDLRGRVMSAQNALLTLAPAVSILGAGVLVEYVSLAAAGAVAAGVWFAAVLMAMALRPLRRVNVTV
ncbi:MFS transporter [Aeromicrobium sp. CF4.19]|uniref:MFS transporter n=1 Tax=Aeromicrobium sp. CF4.19 TaxID=3373082 RepID=UPI003EE5A209